MQTSKVYKGGRRVSVCSRESVGERIRYFRKQRGWSQIELAEGVCSTSLISLIETGATGTTVEMLLKIADKLKVPLQEIYQDVDGECPNVVKLNLAEAYILRGELEMAQEMLGHLESVDNLTLVERQELILLQGMLRNKKRKSEVAIQFLQPLIDEVELHQNAEEELVCKLYTQLGTAFYQLQNFVQAYSAYQRAYQVAMRLPVFEMTAALAAYNLGMIYNELERKEKAIFYLDQAREYFESINDFPKLANAYFYAAVATKNESYATQALQLYQSLEATQMIHVARQYHAYHFVSQKDYRKAAEVLLAVAIDMDIAGYQDHIYTLARAVLICLDHSDVEEARKYIELATVYKDKTPDATSYNLALFYRAKAKFELALGNFDECISEAQKSNDMYHGMGMFIDCADSLDLVVEALQKKGQFEEACDTSKKISLLLRRKEVL